MVARAYYVCDMVTAAPSDAAECVVSVDNRRVSRHGRGDRRQRRWPEGRALAAVAVPSGAFQFCSEASPPCSGSGETAGVPMV